VSESEVKLGGRIMKTENSKAQMRKGVLEYCILLVMGEKPRYAVDIINGLKDSRMIVVEGTLYPLLTRLKNEGLLAYKWEESTMGPPRKYYHLTNKGTATLAEFESSWCEMANAVEILHKKSI
jgi:PadR family transcriptional regulator, regulatory protein PadR